MKQTIKPDFLIAENYGHSFNQETQFGDVDVLGHVNNLAVARYYESARARFQQEIFGTDLYHTNNPLKIVLVDSRTSYMAEIHFPESLVVKSGFGVLGNSSFTTCQALFRDNICVGYCEATLVSMVNGKPTPLTDSIREKMHSRMVTHPQTP